MQSGMIWGRRMNLGLWLRSLGLEQYEAAFREHAIDSDVLSELSDGDLEKIGIPLGDRKRLIKAIRALVANAPGEFTADEIGANAQTGDGTAERRHLTVMICDLVGSTALSARTRSGGHADSDRRLSRGLRPDHTNL